jgi:hypothetical protein
MVKGFITEPGSKVSRERPVAQSSFRLESARFRGVAAGVVGHGEQLTGVGV